MNTDGKFHRETLERWRNMYIEYLEASPKGSRQLREALEQYTAAAQTALDAADYDVAVPDESGTFHHGLSHVLAWIDARRACQGDSSSAIAHSVLGTTAGNHSEELRSHSATLLETIESAIGFLADSEKKC